MRKKSSWNEHLRLSGDGTSLLEAWSSTTGSRPMSLLVGYCFPSNFFLHQAPESSVTAQEQLK